MKKVFLLLAVALSALSLSAQDTRTGFRFGMEAGVNFGDYTSVSFDFTPGAQLNKYFYVGGGLSFDILTENGGLQIPLFAEMKAFLPNRTIAKPYLDLRGGYAINAADAFGAGLLNIGLGVELWDHFNVGMGYAGRFASVTHDIPFYGEYDENVTFSNGYVKVGYRF